MLADKCAQLLPELATAQRFVFDATTREALLNLDKALCKPSLSQVLSAVCKHLAYDPIWVEYADVGGWLITRTSENELCIQPGLGHKFYVVNFPNEDRFGLLYLPNTETFEDYRDYHLSIVVVLLLALHCKNASVAEVKRSSPKKAQQRLSRKQKPNFSHHIVRIDLSKHLERAVSNGTINREEARAHLVRGHFKLRKSGIYWWSPFVRGNISKGIVTKEYSVECTTAIVPVLPATIALPTSH